MKKIIIYILFFAAQTALYAGDHEFPLSPLGPTDELPSFFLASSSSPLPLDALIEKTPSTKRQRTMAPSIPLAGDHTTPDDRFSLFDSTLSPYPSSISTPSQPTAIDLFAIAHENVDSFFFDPGYSTVSPTSNSSSSSSSSSSGSSYPPQEKIEQYLDALFAMNETSSATTSSASTLMSSSSVGSSSLGDWLKSQHTSDSLSSSSSSSSFSAIAQSLPDIPMPHSENIHQTSPDTKLIRCGLCPEEIQPSFFDFNACLAHIEGPAHLNLTEDTIKRYIQKCVSICGIKDSTANSRSNFLCHILSEKHFPTQMAFICAIDSCNEGVRRKKAFKTHIEQKHPDYLLKNPACLLASCDPSSSSLGSDTKLLRCGLCPEEIQPSFFDFDACLAHISGPTHLNLTEDTIQRYMQECVSTCGIKYSSINKRHNFLSHILSEKHLGKTLPFLCAIDSCNEGVRRKQAFKTHIKRKHPDYLLKNSAIASVSADIPNSSSGSDTKLLRCGLCPKEIQPSFFDFTACLAHIEGPAHLNLTKDTIQRYIQECVNICGIKYSSINKRSNFLSHILSEKHLGRTLPFLCAIDSCNQGFRHKIAFKIHIKQEHPDYLLKNSSGLSCRSISISYSLAQSSDSTCSSSSSSSLSPQAVVPDTLFIAENDYSTAASSTSTSSISSSSSSYPIRTPTTISDATDATSAV